jgi:acyl homoserine lactone synthase
MSSHDLDGMHRLRYEVFSQKLGWEVNVKNGMERDEFDDVPEVAYMVAKSGLGTIDACWRLLPSLGPNMLRDIFPELMHGKPAPAGQDCWELSRFAVATDRAGTSNATIGPVSKGLMLEAIRFAHANGIVGYATVTTPVMERMLKHAGIHINRLGSPLRIGVTAAVACMIEVDKQSENAVGYTR